MAEDQNQNNENKKDENNEAKVGDTVTIMETRKLSALKRFRLVSVDKKAVGKHC